MNSGSDGETRQKCLRMWLTAKPRDQIAHELDISEGTVVNIIAFFSQNDSTLELQREIAIVAKKNGIDIFQLASSMWFENALKRRCCGSEPVADFLSALQKQLDLSEITNEQAIKSIIDCSEFCAKQRIPLNDLLKQIQDKYAQLEELKTEITKQMEIIESYKNQTRDAVRESGTTTRDIKDFRTIKDKMDGVGLSLDDASATFNVISNLKHMGYDDAKIIQIFSQTTCAEDHLRKLEEELGALEKGVEEFRIYEAEVKQEWGDIINALQDYGAAMRMGLKFEHFLASITIFGKHFPDWAVEKILKDMRIYGDLSLANFILTRRFNEMSEKNNGSIRL